MTCRVRVAREDGYWVAKTSRFRVLLAGLLDVDGDAFALRGTRCD